MAAAFFKHEGFLYDSYFSEDLLPQIKEQIASDGDTLVEHEQIRDLLMLEFRTHEENFTYAALDLFNQLESCCFYEISESEFVVKIEEIREQQETEEKAQSKSDCTGIGLLQTWQIKTPKAGTPEWKEMQRKHKGAYAYEVHHATYVPTHERMNGCGQYLPD